MNKDVSAQSNVITNIGAGRFRVRSIYIRTPLANPGTMYLQLFNKTAGVPGTDVPDEVIPIFNNVKSPVVKRIKISGSAGVCDWVTGLSFAVTTTANGLTDVGAANRPFVRIDYDGSTLGGAF